MNNRTKSIYWGLAFILIALGILGIAFGWITSDTNRFVWSLVLGIIAIYSLFKLNWFPFFIFVAIIVHINQTYLGLSSMTPVYGAAILLAIGMSILTSGIKKKNHGFTVNINGKDIDFDKSKFRSGQSNSQTMSGDHVMIENNFNEAARYINSDNLVSANIENNFGSLRVYFDQATFSPSGSSINVENNFGKTTLYIPRSVNVSSNLKTTFGAVEGDGRHDFDPNRPTVVVNGDANFGSVEIIIL